MTELQSLYLKNMDLLFIWPFLTLSKRLEGNALRIFGADAGDRINWKIYPQSNHQFSSHL